MDQYYVLNLWEPATPSFCSFAKPYVGSKQDILTVATQLADDDPGSETVRAIQDYFTGNHSATHHIAYQEMPVLTPIRVLASSRMDLPMKTWEHLNVYECPYRMRFEAAEVFQIVICYEGRYHRCVKSRFQNLCYDGINDDWHPVGTMFFGNGCVMRVCETAHQTRLYETNAMLKALDVEGMDWSKLSAVVELVDVQKASNIAFLAEHLDEFSFIPEAKTEEDVGHFLVDNISEYRLNLEMEDYFDFSGFGEHIAEEHDGQFVDGGFIYYDSYESLDELLDGLDPEDEGMNMGGI